MRLVKPKNRNYTVLILSNRPIRIVFVNISFNVELNGTRLYIPKKQEESYINLNFTSNEDYQFIKNYLDTRLPDYSLLKKTKPVNPFLITEFDKFTVNRFIDGSIKIDIKNIEKLNKIFDHWRELGFGFCFHFFKNIKIIL